MRKGYSDVHFAEWEEGLPATISGDPLWRVQAYRLALFAADIGWRDVTRLQQDRRTVALSDQLYRALGSIGANIAEGYSRSSHRDQARFYEYALGSARESRDWYFKGRHVLGDEVLQHRLDLLTQITRLLLRMIPQRRGKSLREAGTEYDAGSNTATGPTVNVSANVRIDESDGAPTITDAISEIERFKAGDLTPLIARLQAELVDCNLNEVSETNALHGVRLELLLAAAMVRRASAQISVLVHAAGILYSLPYLLQQNERIQALSLGAGNAASDFDLQTSHRIAEFKFTHWKTGANAIRKKKLTEDFYKLARADTEKARYLYLLEAERPLRFLHGRANPVKLLNKNQTLQEDFQNRYWPQYGTIGAFYRAHSDTVQIVDLLEAVPGFAEYMSILKDISSNEDLPE